MIQMRAVAVTLMSVAVFSGGCGRRTPPVTPSTASVPPAPVATPAPPAPPAPAAVPAAEATPPLSEDELFARKTLEQLNAERPLADAFFDYDGFTLDDEARAALQRNAEWLRRWPTTRVTIEGHCDARGSNQYNLALGERRALAARAYLGSLGVAADRVQTVSMGEEAPACIEEHEACWKQNRRARFVITAK